VLEGRKLHRRPPAPSSGGLARDAGIETREVYGITGYLDGMLTLWMVKTNVTNSSVHQERIP